LSTLYDQYFNIKLNLIQNSQGVKKMVRPQKAMVKKDVKLNLATRKKWL